MIVAPIPIFILLTAIQFVVVSIIAVLFGIILAVGAIFVVVPVVVILVRTIVNAPVTLLIVTMLVIPAILFLPVFLLARGSGYDRRRGAEPCPQKNHTDVLSCRFHRAISSWFKFDCGIWALSTSMSGACKSSIQGIGYTSPHCACRTSTLADPDLRLMRYRDTSQSGLELSILDVHQIRRLSIRLGNKSGMHEPKRSLAFSFESVSDLPRVANEVVTGERKLEPKPPLLRVQAPAHHEASHKAPVSSTIAGEHALLPNRFEQHPQQIPQRNRRGFLFRLRLPAFQGIEHTLVKAMWVVKREQHALRAIEQLGKGE